MSIDVEALQGLTKLLFDGLAVIIIIILYIKNNNQRDKEKEEEKKRYERLNEDLRKNYETVIKEIISEITHKHLTPDESKNIEQIECRINNLINIVLKESNASRVFVVRYHNGNKDMLGKSFLKMSMTNEVVNLGVSPMMPDFRDIFRSLLTYWCSTIESKNKYLIQNIEELKEKDMTLYQYLKVRNIEGMCGLAIRDANSNVIGFLGLEYLSKTDMNEKQINKVLNKYFAKIETLVSIDGGVINEL